MSRTEAIEFLLLRLRDPKKVIELYGAQPQEIYPIVNHCLGRRMLGKARSEMFDVRPSGYMRYAQLFPLASRAGILVPGDQDHTLASEYALPEEEWPGVKP